MPVLVDGNNLLFAAGDAQPERPPSRSTLCTLLGNWVRRTSRKVHLVFDGPQPADVRVRQMADPDVTLTFSGSGVSADAVLSEIIRTHPAPRRLVVVSSDRAIAKAARARRAKPMRSDEFWKRVERDLARPPRESRLPREKFVGLTPEASERWLRELGLHESGETKHGPPQAAD